MVVSKSAPVTSTVGPETVNPATARKSVLRLPDLPPGADLRGGEGPIPAELNLSSVPVVLDAWTVAAPKAPWVRRGSGSAQGLSAQVTVMVTLRPSESTTDRSSAVRGALQRHDVGDTVTVPVGAVGAVGAVGYLSAPGFRRW